MPSPQGRDNGSGRRCPAIVTCQLREASTLGRVNSPQVNRCLAGISARPENGDVAECVLEAQVNGSCSLALSHVSALVQPDGVEV